MKTKQVQPRVKRMGDASAGRASFPGSIKGLGTSAWRLPSGKALAEFALDTGLVGPLLPGAGPFSTPRVQSERSIATAGTDRLESGLRS
jgi:hypothetical protein